MGWLINTHDRGYRYSNAEIRKYFESRFNSVKILHLSVYGFSEVYMACEHPCRPGEVFAVVCLIRNTKKEFGYKDMSEDMGPYCYNAPKKILDLLTPIDSKYANEWRAECRLRMDKLRRLRKGEIFTYGLARYKPVKVTRSTVIVDELNTRLRYRVPTARIFDQME